MKRRIQQFERLVREDWFLMVVALGIALLLWWNITQREINTKFLPGVEVNLGANLKPSLMLAPTQATKPRVSVYVDGPKAFLDNLTSEDFQINADLADIQSATKHEVFLEPEDFVPKSHLVRALPLDQIRVNKARGITPRKIPVETIWRKSIVPIVPRISGQPARGYIISSSSIYPATITVAGSIEDLEQNKVIRNKNAIRLNGETTMPDQYWTIEDLALGDLEVVDWDPGKPIRVSIQIEPQFMETTIRGVPVVSTSPTDDQVELFYEPATLDVRISGSRAVVPSVTKTSFAMGIDPARVPSGTSTLQARFLTPITLPAGCQIIEVTPSLVNVQMWKPSDYVFPLKEDWLESRPASAGALVAPISSRRRAQSTTPTPAQPAVPEPATRETAPATPDTVVEAIEPATDSSVAPASPEGTAPAPDSLESATAEVDSGTSTPTPP
jgi:YbbR domain-containing protein